jgi:soluble lytic murein transglycosylase
MAGVAACAAAAAPAAAMIPASEASALRQALAAQARGDFRSAEAAQLRGSALSEALLTWDRLRRPDYPATFAETSAFLRQQRGWPGENDIRRRAEGLIDDLTPMASRLVHFRALPPLSGIGRFRHAEALLAAGLVGTADTEVKQAWRGGGIGRAYETQFLAKFGGVLSADDHVARADRLLWSNDVEAARRMLPFLTGDDRALVEARLALKRAAAVRGADRAPAAVDAAAALGRVPAALESHPGLVVDRSAFLRASGNSMAARQLLARSAIAPGSAADRAAWMRELLAVARGAVNDNQHDLAFEIAHDHSGLAFDRPLTSFDDDERDLFTSLEWLAGWTALHRIGRPRDAVRHFENFAGAAKTAITRTRGHYWAGRAASAAGLAADATRNYEAAARFPLAFYGQLAAERLGRPVSLPSLADPGVTPAERQAFNARGPVAAARLFGEVGERGRQTLFLKALADNAKTSAEELLVSELAASLGRTDYALIASRGELADGPPPIMRFAFPQLPLHSNQAHNWTMIHAITRQESRFDQGAVSHAGARGLMQLMPGTARETAGKIGTAYRPEAITGDPAYNILLGSTYYSNLVDQWGGNHVLAVASYNAGPGNVRKWINANGDPRLPGADIIRWIEEIPIFETRNYVQRVLENAVVYDRLRPRTAGGAEPKTLTAYLGGRVAG